MLTKRDKEELLAIFVTKEEFVTRMDAVMYELKAIREEMAIIVYRTQEHSDTLEKIQNIVRK